MIVVTGAAGFIGSCLTWKLNQEGHSDLVLVDNFSKAAKTRNWQGKKFEQAIERVDFPSWFAQNTQKIDFVFHIGARTDTTEFDKTIFAELNVEYSQSMWRICATSSIPIVYASSAATYGLGEHGFHDSHDVVAKLAPLNPYGESKNDFDKWVLAQTTSPPMWAGIKFFNVFGPNEYHKDRMASVVWHTHQQVAATGGMKLFKSHHRDYEDGEQLRDFIYVKDVVSVLYYFLSGRPENGLYNLGTGRARTFFDLARATFSAMGKSEKISFIDTPVDIRQKYQYFTEANMQKLRDAGYEQLFVSLEEGVTDYVQKHLSNGLTYL